MLTIRGLIIWSEISDAAKARDTWNVPEIRSAMQEADVVGPRKIHANGLLSPLNAKRCPGAVARVNF